MNKNLFNKNGLVRVSLFIILNLLNLIACSENKHMIQERLIQKQKDETTLQYNKILATFNESINELKSKYKNSINEEILVAEHDFGFRHLFRVRESDNYSSLYNFICAYNNGEENPKIYNKTDTSYNEFDYQKDKIIFEDIRSKKYIIIRYLISSGDCIYDFSRNQFLINLHPISMKNTTYGYGDKYDVNLIIKSNNGIVLKMSPEVAEKFKNSLDTTDVVYLYTVFKVNGKKMTSDKVGLRQDIKIELVDYKLYQFENVCNRKDHYNGLPDACTTSISIFTK